MVHDRIQHAKKCPVSEISWAVITQQCVYCVTPERLPPVFPLENQTKVQKPFAGRHY